MGDSLVPVTQFPPIVTPNITIVQCQNHEIDLGTFHRPSSAFTRITSICAHTRVSLVLCSFITGVDPCTHWLSQDAELFHHLKLPHAAP